MTSESATARLALLVSSSEVHDWDDASASSQSRYSIFIPAISPPFSSIAILIPLAMVSVCPCAEPVRGMLETILMTFPPLLPQPPQPVRPRSVPEPATVRNLRRSTAGSWYGLRGESCQNVGPKETHVNDPPKQPFQLPSPPVV